MGDIAGFEIDPVSLFGCFAAPPDVIIDAADLTAYHIDMGLK